MTDSIPEWRQKEQKFARAAPEMTLLSDHPILRAPRADGTTDTDRDADSFLLVSKLGSVFDIIRHRKTRAPMAIAVYGDWGTGKSSAMRWLAEQLRDWSETLTDEQRGGHYRVRTVWFDPWKYQKREDVWRGLIAEVILSAVDIGNANLKTVVTAARKFGGFLGRSFISFLGGIKFKAGVPVAGEADLDLESLNKIAEDYRQTVHPEKEHLNAFEDTLKSWIKDQLGAQERMVIFIDDLDRCLPEVVLEVLEALKLYLNIPQLMFVVGLDAEVVRSVVREHYRKHGLGEGKAEHYLAKMFQVEVDIAPSELQIEQYLDAQVDGMDAATDGYWTRMLGVDMSHGAPRAVVQDAIRILAEHNPREIKRLLNSTLLRGSAAQRDESLGLDHARSRDERLLFRQGCQVYLIQQVMRKRIPRSDGLLRHSEVAMFFEQWSQFCHDFPVCDQPLVYAEACGADEGIAQFAQHTADKATTRGRTQVSGAIAQALESLRLHQPTYPDNGTETIPLLSEPDLWPLMRIAFSAQVALSSAIVRRQDSLVAVQDSDVSVIATSETPQSSLLEWPAALLAALSRKVKKEVSRLALDDVKHITELNLSGTDIRDITALGQLRQLCTLRLDNTRISNICALEALSSLQELVLNSTGVRDLGPLRNLVGLRTLMLDKTEIDDLSPLEDLFTLETLSLCDTRVSDIAPLAKLYKLQVLWLDRTRVRDLAPLEKLTRLENLWLSKTPASRDAKRKLEHALPKLAIYC